MLLSAFVAWALLGDRWARKVALGWLAATSCRRRASAMNRAVLRSLSFGQPGNELLPCLEETSEGLWIRLSASTTGRG